MDYPPIGRSRDLMIAKLKGIKKISCESTDFNEAEPKDVFLFYIPSGKPWRTHSIDSCLLPFWSTRVEDAWMLWEELPKDKRYCEYDMKDLKIIIALDEVFEGFSFPDVVTKAWIIWKKSSK